MKSKETVNKFLKSGTVVTFSETTFGFDSDDLNEAIEAINNSLD